jgi:tetratricopeptide (TPR) repeat protein
MVDVAASFVDEFPHVPAWRAGLAVLYAEAGQTDQAATELDRLARGLDDVRRDQNWLFCMGALAEACGRVGNASLARDVYDLLRPHADRFVVLGDGYAVWCSVEQSLGILARTTGRAEAIWHLARALRAERTVGARPVAARTEYEYGLALLGGSESAEEARAHLLVALESARELGMAALARRSERLLAEASVSGVA